MTPAAYTSSDSNLMPSVVNPYTPVGRLYTALGLGEGFSARDDRPVSPGEAAAGDAWLELAMGWAAGFHLARRLGKLAEFERAVVDCNYYSAWAVMALGMPAGGLAEFLRIGTVEADSGAGTYKVFWRLARQSSLSTERGLHGPKQPFLVSEACVSKMRFTDAAYDERVVTLACQIADLLIREPARLQMNLGGLQKQHQVLTQAFLDEFATIRPDAQPGSSKQAGVRRLLTQTWRSLTDAQRARIAWIEPIVVASPRKAARKTPAKSTAGKAGNAKTEPHANPSNTKP